LRNLCGQLSDHAGINLQGELAPEVELRAEGLGLEGGLQGGECHLQLLISREQGKVHKGVRAQLLGPTKQTAACAHTAMSEWMDGWMDGWKEGRMNELMNGQMNEWTDAWINAWANKWTNEWRNGRTNEWVHAFMEEWMKHVQEHEDWAVPE